MSKLYTGSLCLSDILEAAKSKHSAFSKYEKNGKIYANIQVWDNETPDQYGNQISIKLNSSKEMQGKEGNGYIGSAKPAKSNNGYVSESDLNQIPDDKDLPF